MWLPTDKHKNPDLRSFVWVFCDQEPVRQKIVNNFFRIFINTLVNLWKK